MKDEKIEHQNQQNLFQSKTINDQTQKIKEQADRIAKLLKDKENGVVN